MEGGEEEGDDGYWNENAKDSSRWVAGYGSKRRRTVVERREMFGKGK